MALARGGRVVDSGKRRRSRWARGILRACFLAVGILQCLIGVMLGVGFLASAIGNGEGASEFGIAIAVLVFDLALLVAGALALLSALEEWDPPDNRWRGMRWSVLGLGGTAVSLASWTLLLVLFLTA